MRPHAFSGWPDDARQLIEKAAAAHGGFALYERLRSVSLSLVELGGALPYVKGLGRTHPGPPRATVYPHERRAVFHDYPAAGQAGVFDGGDVRLEQDGELLRESRDHRRTFAGLRKLRRWDPLDALYFFGYALVTYLNLPFNLKDTTFVSLTTAGPLRGVTVDFDPAFHTHCRRQTFYFDEAGLLRRHDYVAEIVGAWAHGAHFTDDYVSVSGLQLATRRRVFAAPFHLLTPIPVLRARFTDPSIALAG
jgi:hypothetical protein